MMPSQIPEPNTITALVPTQANPQRISIKVNGQYTATLALSSIQSLGLAVTQRWDDALATRVKQVEQYDKAYQAAMRSIVRKPMTRFELTTKLKKRKFDGQVIDQVMKRFVELDLIDDLKAGQSIIHDIQLRRPAGPKLLRAKLSQKGISQSLIDQLLEQHGQANDDLADAIALTQKRLKTPTIMKLEPAKRKQRLWGLLARRGYDTQVIDHVFDKLDLLHVDDVDEDCHF